MGSLLHFLDANEDRMARKVVMHKRLDGGLEAPRNSLEIPLETSYSLCAARESIPYAYHKKKESEKNCYSNEAPMKKLISEEISKRPNTRQNAPSIVARLMGVDMLPFDSKPASKASEMKNETPESNFLKKHWSGTNSGGRVPSTSNSSLEIDFGCLEDSINRDPDQLRCMRLNRPKPREHPQEEELQKFKKEFEAWQAARFKECSKIAEFGSSPSQLIAQENLNREKMVLYANSERAMASGRLMEPEDLTVIPSLHDKGTLKGWKNDSEYFAAEHKGSPYSRRMSRTDFKASPLMNSDQKPDIVSAPTKIVILRPGLGPERMCSGEDSWNSTPSTSGERGSIEDLLEEVKERLKSELQGKSPKRSTTVRGGGIETPYREKPSEPKQIAQRIAQQVRESVTRDIGMNLLRSESTKSYRSEIQLNGTGSPDFINGDTRRFLAERLKNVLKGETHGEVPMVSHNRSRSSTSDYEKGRAEHSRDIWSGNRMSYHPGVKNEPEKRSRSFRQEPDDVMLHKELSPRNLVRSLSAPVSGTSFGKLLLKDRHILTGAQIRRKHEVIENVSMNMKKRKKEKFNIKEKVSGFRYGLTLRGKLFRRRVQSVEELRQSKHDCMKDIRSQPTVTMSLYDRYENSTEVPPSPASVCSSIHDESWRHGEYFSPTSASDAHQLDDSEIPHVFREINSNLSELRRQLNQLEGNVPEETTYEQPIEVEMEIDNHDEAYVRDLLIAAGLYDGSFKRSLSKWDPHGKPISNQVFEEVEESYIQKSKDGEGCTEDDGENLGHKMLLDLLNEVLPAVLRPPMNMYRYMNKAISSVPQTPHGRNLLNRVWEIIRLCLYPPADKSFYALDGMLARDLMSNPWCGLMEDDINALGKDIECQIIGDLIDEMVKDVKS
ncbi:uncharacterized protein LOC111387408 isoform X1 [Olea europaea var. sylvestris]|uniref:uncharacterized protein LOC111387408 isoform X1 n=2 Tax=Olea europaea var. sylvestris TaxID=158386 RepID=UPI000C1D2D01|nr:uncharacterized protein LOC111387408 isoform X1 [Olea europaea var. sylvestris]